MPNQMIALQARNPQLPNPAQRTARLANMMNMARQTEAAQLQGQRLRQEMDYARAGEDRARETHTSAQKKAEIEYVGLVAEQFSRDVAKLADGNIAGAEALRADIVDKIPAWDNFISPASEWTPEYKARLVLKGKEIFDKIFPDVAVSKEYAAAGGRDAQGNPIPEGTVVDTRVGGFPGAAGSTPLKARSDATPAPRATPTAPPVTAGTDVDMRATRGVNTTPRDLIEQGMDPNNIPSDNPTSRPISFNQSDMGGAGAMQMTPDVMSRIVDSAFQTGVMAQVDFDQLLASQPPQNKQALVESFRRANITLQADAPSLAASAMDTNPVQTPQSQFAVMRGEPMQSQTAGLRGAPPMEQTLAQYIPVMKRDPNVAPTPSPVPAGVIGAQEGARTTASKAVELEMNPRIAAATKNAERNIEKRSEALVAKNETKTLIQSIDKYIEEIDALLRSADRRFIVGRIEGNLHYLGSLGQNERQAELQAMFDRIKNADTLGSLVAMKQATPSGGSPVGNASNQDVQLVAKGANSLTQTGGVPKFDADLKKLRRDAYRTRQNAIEFYNDRYGDLSAEDPKFKLTVRPIADRYISSKDLPKKPVRTPTKSTLSPATRAKYGL
jgi:hypothetical protein